MHNGIFPTPGSAEGVQMKLKETLTEQVTRVLTEGKLSGSEKGNYVIAVIIHKDNYVSQKVWQSCRNR